MFDVNAKDFQGETFEHTSISDGIESLCKLIEGEGLHGDPYKTISCSISKFNNIKVDDEIKKLAKFIIEQERSGDEHNIVAKLSIVYTVVSYEFSELKDKVDEISAFCFWRNTVYIVFHEHIQKSLGEHIIFITKGNYAVSYAKSLPYEKCMIDKIHGWTIKNVIDAFDNDYRRFDNIEIGIRCDNKKFATKVKLMQ